MQFDFQNKTEKTDKEFSQLMDEKIGYQIEKIEQQLCQQFLDEQKHYQLGESRTWVGLSPQIFQTPYPEIDTFFHFLKKFKLERIVDLGAGYGRVAVVMQNFFPEAKFIGFELLEKRCEEANRIFRLYHYHRCSLLSQNILDQKFNFPQADLYFIYDFSDQQDQKKILDILSHKMETDKFFLVVRGKSTRSLIQYKYPEFFRCYGPYHTENWSIYSSWCDLVEE